VDDAKHQHANLIDQVLDVMLFNGQTAEVSPGTMHSAADAWVLGDPRASVVELASVDLRLPITPTPPGVPNDPANVDACLGRKSRLTV